MVKLFKGIAIIICIAGVLYCGACVYSNFIEPKITDVALPSINKAKYEIMINNTGNTLFTDDYEKDGSIIIVKGYYELMDGKYKENQNYLYIDQDDFGIINIKRR